MPLNKKGKKIKKAMVKQYGKKKGNAVFYAMENSGKIKGVKKNRSKQNNLKMIMIATICLVMTIIMLIINKT